MLIQLADKLSKKISWIKVIRLTAAWLVIKLVIDVLFFRQSIHCDISALCFFMLGILSAIGVYFEIERRKSSLFHKYLQLLSAKKESKDATKGSDVQK